MSTSSTELANRLQQHLRLGPEDGLYGIVDGAQDYALAFEALKIFKRRIRPLFEGDSAARLNHVAPYMVPIEAGSGYLERWVARWGKNVGILLVTRGDADELYKHLRHIFVAFDERGQEYFFRYYDPRVLRVYLPTCTPREAKAFFGPMSRIAVEGEQPATILICTPGESGVTIEPQSFGPSSQTPQTTGTLL